MFVVSALALINVPIRSPLAMGIPLQQRFLVGFLGIHSFWFILPLWSCLGGHGMCLLSISWSGYEVKTNIHAPDTQVQTSDHQNT